MRRKLFIVHDDEDIIEDIKRGILKVTDDDSNDESESPEVNTEEQDLSNMEITSEVSEQNSFEAKGDSEKEEDSDEQDCSETMDRNFSEANGDSDKDEDSNEDSMPSDMYEFQDDTSPDKEKLKVSRYIKLNKNDEVITEASKTHPPSKKARIE